jgi:pimeloyl-ACP methyl ester carboxylesterase
LFIKQLGNNNAPVRIIWLHGWAQNHHAFLQLSRLFNTEAENYLIDLPGFGQSEPPKEIWGTMDYTKVIIQWLQTLPPKKTFIIGHSFGGRIAIQTAQSLTTKLGGIILLATTGLKKKRNLLFKIKAFILKSFGKWLRLIDKYLHTSLKGKFSNNFGSRDYKAAKGIMRDILVKTINEDLTTIAMQINIPTLLIYGSNDDETPVEFGQRYSQLIKNSNFFVLPGFDHYTILSSGRHQVYNLITQFLQKV